MTDTQTHTPPPAAVAPPARAEFDPSDVIFLTPGVSDTEASAVIAILRGLLREESDERRSAPGHGQSAWQRNQRSVRSPITPGPGSWRSFSG
ncbi:acyl-CoA carboxylase subunit epsilon [Cryobacterium sp. CG_9.6]|uniref:acyl-CoA carboxylase subunit epsilon n=1 Tax=Cryobacterium sp. CG_9.6 TaxID=2760710 RepID=UPI00247639A2|nr:acyl-CoA carboxylase subunit epsilon [Cryobacterium sp. CG_9.6]MDH6235922.1 hypothetical protein [Cryobacterium sp. CG_9.6]